MIKVLIADDQAMVRAGLRSLLSGEPDLHVVAEVADGAAAVAAVRAHELDVVLMDIRMPVLDGISATRQLASEECGTRVLILTPTPGRPCATTGRGFPRPARHVHRGGLPRSAAP